MGDVSEMVSAIQKEVSLRIKTAKLLDGHFTTSDGHGFYLNQARYAFKDLLGYLPFKEGDRVVLVRDVDAKRGWSHCAHFLKKGQKATIQSIEYYHEYGFSAALVFDNESWIDDKGKKRKTPERNKHTFNLGFTYFEKLRA